MIITEENAKQMRDALIDASPLSERMKEIIKDQYEVSLIHRDVVSELILAISTDYRESVSIRLANLLSFLGEENEV